MAVLNNDQNHKQAAVAPHTVAIGITGHRFLEQTSALISSIDFVLDHISTLWSTTSLTALSALAEGSDRLVAQRILARPYSRLIAPMPMPVEEYVHDFTSPHSQREFWALLAQANKVITFPPASTRPGAYEIVGQYIIEQCDVLVALWNGQPPQGEGGTGAVVARARAMKRPLVWIYTNNQMPGSMLPSSPVPVGNIIFENF